MQTKDIIYFVFDVESMGLHGEGFAVGWTVVDRKGNTLGEGHLSTDYRKVRHSEHAKDVLWVHKHVIPVLPERYNCASVHELRSEFWNAWVKWRKEGAVMVTDCGWPVEARFLIACIDDLPNRQQRAPYPLFDLADMLTACGMDPLATYDRIAGERKVHNPLHDARQTARLFLHTLDELDLVIPMMF